MKRITMAAVARFLLPHIFLFVCTQSFYAQYEKLDLGNSGYDTSVFRKVLPPDGIKAIREPSFITLKDALTDTGFNYLKKDDWLLVIEHEGIKKLYPIMPLIWHEVVNDQSGKLNYAVTYCVLTGSAIVFDRNTDNGHFKTFGVSGCLYNSNLVMYDYQTRSTWPQLFSKCYSGVEKKISLKMLKFSWVKFSYAKTHYQNDLLLVGDSRMPNFKKMYSKFPFQGLDKYADIDTLRFPVNFNDKTKSYAVKEKFLYFPAKNVAVPLSSIKNLKQDMVKVQFDGDQIVCIEPIGDNLFMPIYYFALKTTYPNVKIIQ